MWTWWMPSSAAGCSSSKISCGRAQAHAGLVADVLDAVLAPGGQPRLVTMNVNGPLIIGIRCLSSGSRSCRGIGRSSSEGMKGRSGLMTISPRSRQARPGMRGRTKLTESGRFVGAIQGSALLDQRLCPACSSQVSSGSPRRMKSSAGKGRMVSSVSGVTWVPKAIVRRAERPRQKDAVHVVAQRGRGHLGQVVARASFAPAASRTRASPCGSRCNRRSRPCIGPAAARPTAPGRPAARSCSRGCGGRRGAGSGSRCRRRARAG